MEFVINTSDCMKIDDDELSGLLFQVYVEGGFTTTDEAASLFQPHAVRERGILIGARVKQNLKLAGIIILVPPDSPARRLAQNNEAEIHLLGVKPEYRRHGLGRLIIEFAIEKAKQHGYIKVILWTQYSMNSAQKLYEATGFCHVNDIERNGRKFKVYEMELCA